MPTCKECGQIIPEKGKRVCALCHQTIKRGEKWCFGPDYRARHRSECPPAPLVQSAPAVLAPEPNPMLQFTPEEAI